MYVLAGFLAIGLVCNLAVTHVPERLFTLETSVGAAPVPAAPGGPIEVATAASHWALTAAAWLLVALPLAWGVTRTLGLARQLF